MKKLLFAAAALVLTTTAAHAAPTVIPISDFDGTNGTYDSGVIKGSFDDEFTFTTGTGTSDVSLSTVDKSGLLTFTSLTFDGKALTPFTVPGSKNRYYGINDVPVTAGVQTVEIVGKVSGKNTGDFDGTVDFTSAAPEPATWALMMVGVGGLGLAFRQAQRKHGFTVAKAFAA